MNEMITYSFFQTNETNVKLNAYSSCVKNLALTCILLVLFSNSEQIIKTLDLCTETNINSLHSDVCFGFMFIPSRPTTKCWDFVNCRFTHCIISFFAIPVNFSVSHSVY